LAIVFSAAVPPRTAGFSRLDIEGTAAVRRRAG